MSMPERAIGIAKGYLDRVLSRWEDMDASAQQELEEATKSPALTAWERAQSKIDAAHAQRIGELAPDQQSNVMPPLAEVPASTPTSTSAIEAAYHMLGLPLGSDLPTVQREYQRLKERASPNRFAEGTPERTRASEIERKLNAAYMVLANTLSKPSDDRFDRLEL